MAAIAPYEPRFVEFTTASAGSALTLDFSANGFDQAVPLTVASCTLTITSPRAVCTWLTLRLIQPASGGPCAVVFPASVKGTPPTLSTAANASDVVPLFWNGTNFYFQAAAPITAGVSSFNARTGAVVPTAGDYAASGVTNDSTVTGSTVAAALNTLKAASGVASVFTRVGAVVAAAGDYVASQVNNDSTVSGTHVSDALNALKTSIAAGVSSVYGRTGAVIAAAGDYAASKINNDSAHVAGTHVSDALDSLFALIAASVTGVSSAFGRTGAVVAVAGDYAASLVSNDSSVTGTTVKDALNTLRTASGVASVFGRVGAVVAAAGDYAASKINNDSATVTGTHVSDALDALKALTGVTSVFGRTGAILAVAGDYVASKINNDSTVTGSTVAAALNTLKAASGVSSVFGRTGAVLAVAGDYVASKVTNDSVTVTGTHVSDAIDALLLEYQSAPAVTASRAFALADVGTLLLANSSGAITFTIPTNATVAFKIGSRVSVLVIGTGTVVFSPALGVTIDFGTTMPLAQFTKYHCDKVGTNTWSITGEGILDAIDITDTGSAIGSSGGTVRNTINLLYSALGSLTTSQVGNTSTVTGSTATDALNTVSARIAADEVFLSKGDLVLPINRINDGNTNWILNFGIAWSGNGTATEILFAAGPLPVGSTITAVTVRIAPASGHGGNKPLAMPIVKLHQFSATGSSVSPSVRGTAVDPSATATIYESAHDIVLSGLSITPVADSSFVIGLTDEGSTHAVAGLFLVAATLTLG